MKKIVGKNKKQGKYPTGSRKAFSLESAYSKSDKFTVF